MKNTVFALLVALLTACGGGGPSDGTLGPTLTAVKITPSSTTIHAGERFNLTAEGVYSDGSVLPVLPWSWRTSNPDVVDVSGSSSSITAKAQGEATLSAEVRSTSNGRVTGTVLIRVLPAKPTSLSIMGFSRSTVSTKTTYSTKDERQLSLSVIYTDGIREPTLPTTWTSSNTSVLTVSNTGYLKAVGEGEATITAQNGNLSTSQKISIVSPDAAPTFVIYCNSSQQGPISAGLWNQKIIADAFNSREWITVDHDSCRAFDAVKLLYQENPGDSTYYALMVAQRNNVAGRFEAPMTLPSSISKGQTLTVGHSTSINAIVFTKVFDFTAAD